MTLQVVQSINTGSTSNTNNGGITAVNDSTPPPQANNPNPDGGDRLIYTKKYNLTDEDYTNYYMTIRPALPREYTGVGVVSITGSYTGTGNNINITSSTTIISFTGGLIGSLSVSFSGLISGGGTTLYLPNLSGITNPTVQPNGPTILPLNLTIRIFNATVSGTNLTAAVSMQFTPAFVNLNSGIDYPLAPGSISSNFSGGNLTGFSGKLGTISFPSKNIIHQIF